MVKILSTWRISLTTFDIHNLNQKKNLVAFFWNEKKLKNRKHVIIEILKTIKENLKGFELKKQQRFYLKQLNDLVVK